jgi:hypothetical protein
MKRIYYQSIGALALMLFTASCGSRTDSRAIVKDVNDSNKLIWQDQGKIYTGSCAKDLPVNRANCSANIAQQTLEQATKKANENAQRDLSKATYDVNAEIKSLKDKDPSIIAMKADIANLSKQRDELAKTTAATSKALKSQQDLKPKFEAEISNRDAQIVAIDKRLQQTPNDHDLIRLRLQLSDERARFAERLAACVAMIDTLTKKLDWDNKELSDVNSDLLVAEKELKDAYDTLPVTSEQLVSLQSRLSLVQAGIAAMPGVFEYISRADITYRGNLLSPQQQLTLTWIMVSSVTLEQGRYVVESGYTDFCDQQVRTEYSNYVLTKIQITYLSPCGGSSEVFTCGEATCGNSSNKTVTVLSRDHYRFKRGSDVAVFKFSRADWQEPGTSEPRSHSDIQRH